MDTEDCIRSSDGLYRYEIELYDGTEYYVISSRMPIEDVEDLSMLGHGVWYTFSVDRGEGRTGTVSIRSEDIKSVSWPHPCEGDEESSCIDPRCDIGETYLETDDEE